ncbi:hypothetical protein ABTM60_19775, partial [Acinetobacter baumannii]
RIKGPADLTSFAAPAALAVCPDGGIVFSDGWAYTLGKVISPDAVSVLAGTPGVEGAADGAGQGTTLAAATAMTSDAAGNVYFADTRQ